MLIESMSVVGTYISLIISTSVLVEGVSISTTLTLNNTKFTWICVQSRPLMQKRKDLQPWRVFFM